MRNRISFLFLVFLAGFSFAGCQGTDLFDQLNDSCVSVVVKGTFESNDPRPWVTTVINDDSIVYVNPDQVVANAYNNSVDVNSASVSSSGLPSVATQYQQFPATFMLDIAEIRADDDKFANHREVYNCSINAGLISSDTDNFFNGTGLSYTADNLTKNQTYSGLNIYLRKMAFDNSYVFNLAGGDIDPSGTNTTNDKAATSGFIRQNTFVFNTNQNQVGFDFNIDFMWAYYDTLLESQMTLNRVFPVNVPISGGVVSDCSRKVVIEVRFVIKNFVKRYENAITDLDTTTMRSCHFFSFSDKVMDVRPYRAAYLGGNLLVAARSYYPDSVGTISGTVPGGAQCIVMAIPVSEIGTLDATYQYATIPTIADDYSSVFPAEYNTAISVSRLVYENDVQNYLSQFSTYYGHLTDETATTPSSTPYATEWTNYDTVCAGYQVPPLSTYTDASGNYTLKNVPVGTAYQLYYSTRDTGTSTTGIPAQGELPCGWTSIGSATVLSPNSVCQM
jgi:hypothetical protein